MSDKKITQEDFLLDLHRQFAENFNSILGSCIALLVAALGAVGAFGYVFLNSDNILCANYWTMKACDGSYTVNAIVYASLGALIVLWGIVRILIYQGVSSRKEQFIVYTIRNKYNLKPGEGILPRGYHPYEDINPINPLHGFKIMHGLYAEITKILLIFSGIIFIATILRIIFSEKCGCNNVDDFTTIIYVLSAVCFYFIDLWRYWSKQREKYLKAVKEYSP